MFDQQCLFLFIFNRSYKWGTLLSIVFILLIKVDSDLLDDEVPNFIVKISVNSLPSKIVGKMKWMTISGFFPQGSTSMLALLLSPSHASQI